jgi:Domain of unknown function (DUF1844)
MSPSSTDAPEEADSLGGGDEAHATDFASFLLSLGSSTLVHLGELEHPDHASPSKNLALAKQSLDILSMLQEKTRGNLSAEETRLLEQLLYELRMKYVAARG